MRFSYSAIRQGGLNSSVPRSVRERRRRLAPDDSRGLVDELVVLECVHHEEGEVDAAREVAFEDGIAHVPAPDGQALALALLEVAAAHDRPARVAGEHPPARLDLIVEVGEASEAGERPPDFHERPELPRVDVLAVEGDVPATGEHEARSWRAWSSTAWAVPVEYPWTPRGTSTTSTPSHPATARLMTSVSSVAPGTIVMRPLNASSLPTLSSRHTPTTSWPRSSACCTM